MKSKKKSESLFQEIFKNKKIGSTSNPQAKPELQSSAHSKVFTSTRTTLVSKRSNVTTADLEHEFIQRSKSHASIDPSSFFLSSRANFHSPRAHPTKSFQVNSPKSYSNIVTTDFSNNRKSHVTSFNLVQDQSNETKKSFLTIPVEIKPFSPSRPITSKSPKTSGQLSRTKQVQDIYRKSSVGEVNFSKNELKALVYFNWSWKQRPIFLRARILFATEQ